MQPIKFNGMNTTYAKNHPKYLSLPAHKDNNGIVTSCWHLDWKERLLVLLTGRVYSQVVTDNKGLQPQKLVVDNPVINKGE